LNPAPGAPPSSGASYGVADASFTGKRFDINNLPSPATWNALGHQHAYPDLFHFANGNKVVTIEDWEIRRKEISKILQYYEYGVMPSIAAEDISIEWQDSSGGLTSAITVTNLKNLKTYQFTIATNLPGADPANKYSTETKTGGYSLYFDSGTSANWTGGTASFPTAQAQVQGLFDISSTDPSAPGEFSANAWVMSVVLTVMEEGGFGSWYNPNHIGITGYSRGGKNAEGIAAFAESRGGARVGHVTVGSTGSAGPALERFLSPAGYQVNGKYADPLPIGAAGLMKYEGLIGKPWYLSAITNDTPIPGTSLTHGATINGTADDKRFKAVRGWSPYFEAYVQTPVKDSVQGTVAVDGTTPHVGWQSSMEQWSGLQSLSEARNEEPTWFSGRFQEFADLHYGLDIDHVRGNEGRSKYGVLCTIPFDQHFYAALIPPNGMMFQDGFIVPRNNPESQMATWLIIDEVYKFYGEQESSNPNKYIWRNGMVLTWGTHGSGRGNETADMHYHAAKIFAGEADDTHALADSNLAKMRVPMFPVDDPVARFDYARMTWGRPGHPTIAERVAERLPPTLLTAYEAGEALRPAPSAGAPATHPAYTVPDGTPKFKAMDWRGLIDTPENL
jgi:hypothetical protein